MRILAQDGEVLVQLGDTFHAEDARRIGNTVRSLAPGTKLVVDFTMVRESHDAALFSLSDALRSFRDGLMLRGLTRHQVRLLDYLGVGGRSNGDRPC